MKLGVDDELNDKEREKPAFEMIFREIPQLFMSPFLNLNTPIKLHQPPAEPQTTQISKRIMFD